MNTVQFTAQMVFISLWVILPASKFKQNLLILFKLMQKQFIANKIALRVVTYGNNEIQLVSLARICLKLFTAYVRYRCSVH